MFTLAIVGRPNVGKSTLFNRLTGLQHALVDDQPGVTRDWREGEAHLGGLSFQVLDTAGLEQAKEETLQNRMSNMTLEAIKQADAVLFLIDGRAGVTPTDRHFAAELRKYKKPVILGANKCEGSKVSSAALAEAYALGLGEPMALSAAHGEGLGGLYDALTGLGAKPAAEEEAEMEEVIPDLQIAILGRPNAGKSTLLNALIGKERVLTGPEPGMTRDAIAVEYTYKGKKLKLIDTAGMRRKAKVDEKLESLAVDDSIRALRYAHVAVLVIDVHMPLEQQDMAVAGLIEREGRAMVLAVNKWDEIQEQQAVLKEIHYRLEHLMPQLEGLPVVPVSALRGKNLNKLMDACFDAYAVWNKRLSTGKLNRWLEDSMAHHSPPMVNGKPVKIRYMTQIKTRPPHFALFVNQIKALPQDYQRYLLASLRQHFGLPGVPLRMSLRKGKNPYEKKG